MSQISRRQFLQTSFVASGALLNGSRWVSAAPWTPGVESRASASITGEERSLQADIWALELNYKPLRMITVDLPDAKTSEPGQKLIWYLAYRVANRVIPGLPPQKWEPGAEPIFVPQFTLVSYDGGQEKKYLDRVIPIAQAAILKRERYPYKNSVEIVGTVPPVTPLEAKPGTEKSLDGVAMWRGISAKTKRFKVLVTGLSNGYQKVQEQDGTTTIQRKTLMLDFWRPSDEFDQNEREIRPNPQNDQPQWIYR